MKGTAVRKDYQNEEIDTSQPAVPDTVSVALAGLAGEMREGLLALAVGTGLQVMAALMEADVTAVCGPKGRHDPERTATRHGHGAGSVSLGGRRVPVARPRMRAVDGSGELAVAAYELFSDTEVLGRMALDRMLAGCPPATTGSGWNRSEHAPRPPPRRPRAPPCRAGSSPRPRPPWPSCSPRTCPAWISWRSWSTACTSASTPAWSLSGSTSTAPSTRCRWSRARRRTPPWSPN